MNKSEHTPGPWQVYQLSPDSDPQERWIVTADEHDREVCGIIDSVEDARLIAAAPNLLAACRGLLTFAVPLDPEAVEHVYAARRAIEQATTNHYPAAKRQNQNSEK